MKHRASSRKAVPTRSPNWLLWVTGALYFSLPFIISPSGIEKFRTPKDIVLIGFCCLAMATFLITRQLQFSRLSNRWNLALLLTVAYTVLHVLVLAPRDTSLPALFNLLFLLLLMLLLVEVVDQSSLRTLWMVAGIGIALNALLTILQYFGLFPLMTQLTGEELSGRLTTAGLIGEVNSGGFLFALTALIASAGLLSEEARWRRIVWSLILLFTLLGLIFTRTLTAVAGFSVCLTIWILWQHWWVLVRRQGNIRWLVGFWGVFLVAGAISFAISSRAGLTDRIVGVARQVSRGDLASATAGRQPIFQLTWHMISERPMLGRGLNSFAMDFFSFRADTKVGQSVQLLTQPGAFRQTHNEYLQLWEELGVLGLVGWAGLLVVLLWHSIRAALSAPDRATAYWRFHLFLGLILLAFTSLTFFPFRVGLTAAFAVLLVAGVRSEMTERDPDPPGWLTWQQKVPRAGFVALGIFVLTLAGWLGLSRWQAHHDTGYAASLLEVARQNPAGRSRRVLVGQALALLDHAKQGAPTIFEIESLQGTGNFLLGRYDASAEHYRQAAHYLPSPEAYTNLAAALIGARQPLEATQLLEKALRYNPKYVPAQQALEVARQGF